MEGLVDFDTVPKLFKTILNYDKSLCQKTIRLTNPEKLLFNESVDRVSSNIEGKDTSDAKTSSDSKTESPSKSTASYTAKSVAPLKISLKKMPLNQLKTKKRGRHKKEIIVPTDTTVNHILL